jgi:transcriptional regulator with GAF, ATPase, and Fis domain
MTGNVCELENVIQRAIILAHGQIHNFNVKLAMTSVRESYGNKTLAARSLQISRAYLHRLIRIPDSDLRAERNRLAAVDPFVEPNRFHARIA